MLSLLPYATTSLILAVPMGVNRMGMLAEDAPSLSKSCACISDVGNMLREHNACLVTTLFAKPERVVITTYKIDAKKRGKLPSMLATFCPFCGAHYGDGAGGDPRPPPADRSPRRAKRSEGTDT